MGGAVTGVDRDNMDEVNQRRESQPTPIRNDVTHDEAALPRAEQPRQPLERNPRTGSMAQRKLPLNVRVRRMMSWFEQFIVRHRTTLALIFGYCSFFRRIYDESGKFGNPALGPVPTPLSSGQMLLDPSVVEPLTRSSVLSRLKTLNASGKSTGAGLRREKPAQWNKEVIQEAEMPEDPLGRIEKALQLLVAKEDPVHRARLLTETYTSLGYIHSAHGRYYEMLHAMALALRTSASAGDNDTVSELHVTLGNLELKHHRYYAAGTRFEDALQSGQGANFNNFTRVEALAGLGWAMLMQANPKAAGTHFLTALGWLRSGATLNDSLFVATSDAVDRHGCRAHLDGLDGVRVLALAGLGLASAFPAVSKDHKPVFRAIDCAVSLFQGVPKQFQEPYVWHALGLARHVMIDPSVSPAARLAATRRYHHRAAMQGHQDPSISVSGKDAPTLSHIVTMCATAADLTSCAQNALHMGLVDFSAGNSSLGMSHVEQLLSRTGEVSAEAAEWLIRFARAHAWTPSGASFASFLLGRAEPLLRSEGEARLARHLFDHGRLLLAQRKPFQLKRGLSQLSRARDIIEKGNVGWSDAEVAGFYSTVGAGQHEAGQIEDAIRSFEKALEHGKRAVAGGDLQSRKRLLLAHANLGALRLQVAGADPRRWRVALADLQEGRRSAREAGLSSIDPVVKGLEDSYRTAMRLAHRRGVLQTCPGPLDALLYGLSCPRDSESMD